MDNSSWAQNYSGYVINSSLLNSSLNFNNSLNWTDIANYNISLVSGLI